MSKKQIAYTLELTRDEAVGLCLLASCSGWVPPFLRAIESELTDADSGLSAAQFKLWRKLGSPSIDLAPLKDAVS